MSAPFKSPVDKPPTSSDTAGNKAIAYRAQHSLLVDLDMSALDRYWSVDYIQHNPNLRNGLPELKKFKETNVPRAKTTILHCIGDRDLVFFLEKVSGLMPIDLCFFDVYRIEDGKIVEHWDMFQPIEGPNRAGRTIFDGQLKTNDIGQTDETRALAIKIVNNVFVLEQIDRLAAYVHPDLIQHTPGLADGILGLEQRFLEAQWFTGAITYHALRRIIAEGDFAVTCCDGAIGGVPHVFYDMWRVEADKVVEHWGLHQDAKPSMFHRNPKV